MLGLIDDYKLEVGIAVAVFTIVFVGKIFFGGESSNNKRKNEQTEDSNKKTKSEDAPVQDTQNTTSSDYEEAVVAKVSDLKDGEMKEFPLGEGQVLVVKDKNEIFATSTKCSHQGAPLRTGYYCNGRIRCPWHGACFNAKTGDIEDYPCVDAIQAYKVEVKNDDVIVRAPKAALKVSKRTKKMAQAASNDARVTVIVGAGPAGLICAETLRQDGYTGRIIMIGKEPHLPYDRTKLSKAMNSQAAQILLRQPEFFKQHNIETLLGREVTEFDPESKTVTLKDGEKITFDYGVIASGGDPRTLPVPGMNLANIYQLRVPEDSAGIVNLVDGKKVVIVGTSFIGMEAAAQVVKKAASVIAIGMEKVPFERVLGSQIGSALQKLHEKNNVQFKLERVVKEFLGQDGKVTGVILDNGESLDAELVIVGAGIIPATKFVKKDTLKLERDGSIVADKHLKAAENVYVVGDLARFPFFLTGENIRVEHYGMAMYLGSVAAHNIMGKEVEVHSIPFFWTTQFGKNIRYAGHAVSFDDLIIDGDVDNFNFAGFYVRKNQILAVVGVGRDQIVAAAAELFNAGKMPTADQLKEKNMNLLVFA